MSQHMELASAAYKLASEILQVKKGEEVLIVVDTAGDEDVAKAIANACKIRGARTSIAWFDTNPKVAMDPPKTVIAAWNSADVVVELAVKYVMYSKAYEEMVKRNRVRWMNITGMNVESMVRSIGMPDYPVLLKFGEKLVELTQAADKVRITNSAGTDITAHNNGRKVVQMGGIARKPGQYVLGGQVGWNPVEETINGRIAVDGWEWNIGLVRTPIKLTVKKGRVKDLTGGWEAKAFSSWFSGFNDPNMYRIAHYTYGFNPGVVRLTGLQNDDERVFGTFTFGFGTQGSLIPGPGWKAAGHTDVGIMYPSIYLDDVAIELEGKYVHPDLAKLAKRLNVSGY